MDPLLYHAHHNAHLEDLPLWLKLAQQQGGPLLELGCGTGRVLIPLARLGYAAFGLDVDGEMLRCLLENLSGEPGLRAYLFQSDMTCFHLETGFSLILMPCNTLSTLPEEACRQVFRRVRQHLLPGGLFAASLPNPRLLLDLPRRGAEEVEEVFAHPRSGNPVQVSSAWQRSGDSFELTWHYDHLLPDGTVQRLTESTLHRVASAQVYLDELQVAGLAPLGPLGDFDGSAYTTDSPELILLAWRL